MKKKLYIGAITLVIAGLLLTSATGMSLSTQSSRDIEIREIEKPSSEEYEEVISLFLNNPEQFIKADFLQTQRFDLSEFTGLNSVSMLAQTKESQHAETAHYQLSTMGMRQPYLVMNTHPALADRCTEDHLFLIHEIEFQNGSNPADNFKTLFFQSSWDNAGNWSEAIFFSIQDEPAKWKHPSVVYAGKNDTLDRWLFTFASEVPGHTAWVPIGEFQTDDVSIEDLLMAYYDIPVYNLSGYENLWHPTMDHIDQYSDDGFWVLSGTMINNNAPADGKRVPFYAYPDIETPGSAWFPWWNMQAHGPNDVCIDKATGNVLVTWEVTWPDGIQRWMLHYNQAPLMDNQTGTGWGHDIWKWSSPSCATYNQAILVGLESYNSSLDPTGTYKRATAVKHGDGDIGSVEEVWGWSWDEGTLIHPEMKHIAGNWYVFAFMAVNVSNPLDSALIVTETFDAGLTWEDAWVFSGEDIVYPAEYRNLEISKGGKWIMWSYLFDFEVDFRVYLHMKQFAESLPIITVSGNVYRDFAPVWPISVELYNLNPANMWKKTMVNTELNTYSFELLTVIDVDIDDTLRIVAKYLDETDVGVEEVQILWFDDVVVDIDLDIHYRDLTDFPFYVSQVDTGAMVMKQMLDFLRWSNIANPEGPPSVYSEQELFDAYRDYNFPGLYYDDDSVIDEYQLALGLVNEIRTTFPVPPEYPFGACGYYGYFFSANARETALDALKWACTWIDYPVDFHNDIRYSPVPQPGHTNHVPVAVPTGGNYDNWMVIRGIHTSANAWPYGSEFDIYGFWINDPSVGGIGNNWYMTAQYFMDNYFDAMTVGLNQGQYVVVVDPPEVGLSIEEMEAAVARTNIGLAEQVSASQQDIRLVRLASRVGLSSVSNPIIMNTALTAYAGVCPDAITSVASIQETAIGYNVVLENGDVVVLNRNLVFCGIQFA